MTSLVTLADLEVRLDDGRLAFVAGGAAWLNVSPELVSDLGVTVFDNLVLLAQEGSPEDGFDLRLSGEHAEGTVNVRVGIAAAAPALLVTLEFTARQDITLESLRLAGRLDGGFDRVWKQGWQSWTPACVLPLGGPDLVEQPPVNAFQPARAGIQSSDVALVAGPGVSICIGMLAADRFLGRIAVVEGVLQCEWLAGGVRVAGGEVLSAEALRIDFSLPAAGALDRYAEAVSAHSNVELAGESPAGWCSWYYYFTEVSEQAVLENLEFLRNHRRQLPLQYIQLDDGYQADIGDWTDWNGKFPRGPRWLTDQIHEAGFQAGVWLAPFIAGENSRLAREHPDWLLRDENGEPIVALTNWNQRNYALDLTHPGVEDWLGALFTTVGEDWGFDYFKIDFVFAGGIRGERHDPARTPLQAYRDGLAAIRRAVGERFVLGCGALQLPSVGLVDGMRIGPDVMLWWRHRGYPRPGGGYEPPPVINGEPSAEASIRNIMNRLWMHGRLWANDPDCVLVRETRSKLTTAEVESLATVIGLSAGMTLLSDNLLELSPEAIHRLSFILPPLRKPARVVGLLDSDMPQRLDLQAGDRLVVALFNWSDEERDLSLRLTEARVFDVFAERSLGVVRDEIVLAGVPPHGCRLLTLTSAGDRPRLLASSFHIGQGSLELVEELYDEADGSLLLKLRPVAVREGTLWVSWPRSSVEVDGPCRAHGLEDGVVRIDLTLDDPTELTVR